MFDSLMIVNLFLVLLMILFLLMLLYINQNKDISSLYVIDEHQSRVYLNLVFKRIVEIEKQLEKLDLNNHEDLQIHHKLSDERLDLMRISSIFKNE